MLNIAHPIQFNRAMQTGKSEPLLLTCELDGGERIEVIAKFSEGLERKETSLAIEVVSACLAADLGLPVPVPYLIQVDQDWIESLPIGKERHLVTSSSFMSFGSTYAGTGFNAWMSGEPIRQDLKQCALEIFAFDCFIANPDRRTVNPNCLVKGDQIRIIDHDLAFFHKGTLGWRAPWVPGSLSDMARKGNHIFFDGLKGTELNIEPIQQAWIGLDDERLQDYRAAVPQAWNSAEAITDALDLIKGVRENINFALTEVRRVLS
ncbi:HipA family kinase [Rhodomicrobium sp. Az07]|uniref:HipA family kinase n=1 Tax=Rhodomicrobium sp. Az07 TaxID=2839034 RepID=UPI00352FFABD